MNIARSMLALTLLTALAGCGSEQFGTVPQAEKSVANELKVFQQLSCSSHTLIKPKVDILYVVDNSTSTYYVPSEVKSAIKATVDSISTQFDYRMVGTNLISTTGDANPFDDYQLMTNSQDALNAEAVDRRVISSTELNFFSNPAGGSNEAGLKRILDFMNNHIGNGDSLFRQGAYHIVVLISNGRDVQVEHDLGYGNGQTAYTKESDGVTLVYNTRLASFNALKASLSSQQFRLFSVTAQTNCQSGWLGSSKSYVKMARDLYAATGATDNNLKQDAYDLCGNGISSIFAAVNNSIQQVVIPHTYKYWPITFTDSDFDVSKLKVFKSSPTSAPVELTSGWQYKLNPNYPAPYDTRILPSAGEPTTARHLIEFLPGNEVVTPHCISVSSTSKTEYFGFVVLPQEPRVETVSLRINGTPIPQSATSGWTYVGSKLGQNIKVPHPAPGDELPAVTKTGFMLQLNGAGNYYKSGDNVEIYYLPAGI